MISLPIPRIDLDEKLHRLLLPYCRLKKGEVWEDSISGHRVACIDAASKTDLDILVGSESAQLAIHDPPYNFIAFSEQEVAEFISWCRDWVINSYKFLSDNSSFYVWLGADQNNNFQPFPEFILMMKDTGFRSRSFITMRNQRGYGTQKNWMSVRQELLYYVKGKPYFNPDAEYTDIPKILKGYYKFVNGKETENSERSKSEFIRAGNVWVDIQQVFYRMEENVNGCFAQKPLKSVSRIIHSSTKPGELVVDFFSHSGTTLLASEILGRTCYCCDIDPVFCEISIRRLEKFRESGKTGWQNSNPFMEEIISDSRIRKYLGERYNIRISKELMLSLKKNNK